MSEREDLWYYNLSTHEVEHGDGGRAEDRLGPYPSREAAEAALQQVQQRNESWDNDPEWTDSAPAGPDKGELGEGAPRP